MTNEEKLIKGANEIISHFGICHQLKKLQEEVFEFCEAVIKFGCGYDTKEHITEEFADVMVIMYQFLTHYDLDDDEIINFIKFKIERTLKRINEESKNDK